ncbi:ER lumen protein-retaining receptor [Galdieria sulphuraria]|nr:ER lumen protein-retaining receptor [Galdieria sulphuraria]
MALSSSMNVFRIAGDLLHCISIFILLHKMRKTRTCTGISRKTLELYAIVFLTRYLDLFTGGYFDSALSLYNTVLKLLFLASTFYCVYLLRVKYRHTYDRSHDTFRVPFLLGAAAVLAFIFPQRYTILEILWSFSQYLEAVAILPQLLLLQRTGEVENLTSHYIFCLGAYRGCYVLNWIWRFFTDSTYRGQYVTWTAGLIQTSLYADFFYYYLKYKKQGRALKLPP